MNSDWIKKNKTPLAIFAVAWLCRIAFLISIKPAVYYQHLFGDADYFDKYAWKLAQGLLAGETIEITLSPVFLGYLAAIYKIFGHHIAAIRLIQSLLGSLTSVLIYRCGKKTFGREAGIAAGFAAALYGIFIFYDAEILKPCLINFLVISSLYLFQTADSKNRARAVFASLIFSLAMLLRMDLLLPFTLILVWHFVKERKNPLRAGITAVLVLAAAALNIWMWQAAYQKAAPKQNAPFAQAGIHFYIGNQPGATGTYKPVPGIRNDAFGHNQDAKRIAEEEMKRPLNAAGINAYWIKKGWEYMRSNPKAAWAVIGKKFFLLFNVYEIPSLENYDYSREVSWFLGLPLVSFGLISPFGLLGLILSRKNQTSGVSLLRLFFFGYALSLLIMIVRGDYRLPIHLPLLIFAGYSFTQIKNEFIARSKNLKPHVLLLLCLYLFTNYQTFLSEQYYRNFITGRIQRGLKELGLSGKQTDEGKKEQPLTSVTPAETSASNPHNNQNS